MTQRKDRAPIPEQEATATLLARLRNAAMKYGRPDGMMGCSIAGPSKAMGFFKLTRGYAFVAVDGMQEKSAFLLYKEDALQAWGDWIGIQVTKPKESVRT